MNPLIVSRAKMESISDLIETYDAANGKSSVAALKELLKELRKSKVCVRICSL